jgi:hypothetical protein
MAARVVISAVAGALSGRSWAFDGHDTFIFGRSPDCHAELPESDGTASRHHFLLEVNPPAARVRDLGSLNGTWVNGVRHGGRGAHETPEQAAHRAFPEVDLGHGDEVRVGGSVFRLQVEQPCAGCGAGIPPGSAEDDGLLCASCRASDTARCPRCGKPSAAVGATCGACSSASPLVFAEVAGGRTPVVPGYEIGRLLGKGGMGAVYLARRQGDSTTVALKLLLAQQVVEETAREGFLREVEVTRSLRHPSIVEIHDHGATGATFWFAMEYCPGGSVHEGLKRTAGPWPLDTVAPLALQALDGLAHAHAMGFVHRDLKPENLLLAGSTVKVTDFGLAKSFQQAGLSGMTATGTAAGTLTFMPREQLTQFRHVRPASDVWSMAATIYFMLTRQFARDFRPGVDPLQVILKGGTVPLRARDPRLPTAVALVLDRALSDDVAARQPTAAELRDELARALA